MELWIKVFEVILPVIIVILTGFCFGKVTNVNLKPVNLLLLYISTPCLIFSSLMDGKIIPDGLLTLNPFYINFFENMKMFQFCHRLLGTIIMLYSGWFFILSQNEFYNKYSGLLFIGFIIQLYIGIMTLLLKVPIVLGILHQGVAVLLLYSLLPFLLKISVYHIFQHYI